MASLRESFVVNKFIDKRKSWALNSSIDKRILAAFVLIIGAASVVGVLAAQQSFMIVGGLLVIIIMGIATIIRPQVPTLAVIFVLFSNAAVIAVDFHGVPWIVGASLPVLLVIPLANYLLFERRPIIVDTAFILILALAIVQLVGSLFAVAIDDAITKLTTFLVEAVGLYFLIINTVRSRRLVHFSVWTLVFAGVFLGFLSAYQQATATFENDYYGFAQSSNAAFGTGEETLQGEVEQTRLGGPLGQHNRYAQIMLMIVPLALFRFLGEPSKWLRPLAAVATILIMVGAALTFSRGGAIGFLLMIVIMAFLRYISIRQLVAMILALMLVSQLFPQFGTRLTSLERLTGLLQGEGGSSINQADGATQSRITEMLAAALMYADYPIIGVGPGMYRNHYIEYADLVGIKAKNEERQAHNLYLGLAAETGTLGIIAFGMILFITFRNLGRVRRYWINIRPDEANIATSFILAIASYLATGMFLHFAFIRYFWLIVALAGAVCHVSEVEKEKYELREATRRRAQAIAEAPI